MSEGKAWVDDVMVWLSGLGSGNVRLMIVAWRATWT